MTSMVPSLKHPEARKPRRAMLGFRLVCAGIVAWAVNWVMGRPVAAELLELVPEMSYIAPMAGGLVGFIALARRQGWGILVAMANGVWTMLMTVALAWLIFLTVTLFDHIAHGLIADFENFLRVLGAETRPLAEGWVNPRLVGILLAATVAAGVITEILHWLLVRLRRARGVEDEEGEETEAA